MIASHCNPVSIAEPNIYILAMNPTVGGIPIKEIIERVITTAKIGDLFMRLLNDPIDSFPPLLLDTATITAKAARFVMA